MAQRDIQLKIDATVDSADAAKSLGQLRRTLLEIEQLQSQIGDESSENFQKLQAAAQQTTARMAAVRDSVGDIQDRVRTLEGTQVERLTGSFGLLKEGIMNLDFDKISIGLEGMEGVGKEKLLSLKNTLTDFGQGIKDNFAKLGQKDTYAGINDGLKGVGENLKGMGGKAMEAFSTFTKAPIASIGGGLKGLAGGFGTLTKSIITNTIALLSNPLFLAAVVIGAIVVAIVALIAKFGLLTKAIEIMGKAFEFITGLFEAFTDLLGLTTNAQNKFAADTKAAEEKRRQEIQKTLSTQEEVYGRVKGMTEEEIAGIYGKEEAEKIVAQNIFDIRMKSEQDTRRSISKEIAALDEITKAGGKLTDEQAEDRKKLAEEYEKSVEREKQAERDKAQTIQQLNADVANQLERWRVKNIKDADERRKRELQMEKETQLRTIETQLVIARGLGQTEAITQLEETKKEINEFYRNEEVKINDAKNQRVAQSNKTAADKEKQRIQDSLKELVYTEDQKIKKQTEGSQERFQAEVSKYEVMKKFYEDNRKTFGKETDKLIAELDEKIAKTKADAQTAAQELTNRELTAAAERNVLKAEQDEIEVNLEQAKLTKLDEARIASIQLQRDIELQNTKLTADERKLIEERAAKEISDIKLNRLKTDEANQTDALQKEKEIRNGLIQDVKSREEEASQNKISRLQRELEEEETTKERKLEILMEIQDEELKALEAKRQKELADIEEIRLKRLENAGTDAALIAEINANATAERSQADANYEEGRVQLNEDTNEKIKEVEAETTSLLSKEQETRARKGIEQGREVLAASTNLANAIFSIQDTFGKKGTEAEKKRAKQQFEIRKALSIGGAVISTIEGVVNALTAKSMIPEPFAQILRVINAASIGAAGIANIAKIASQKFEAPSTSVSPTTPSDSGTGGAPGMGGAPAAAEIPQFTPAQFFNVGQGPGLQGGSQQPIQVVVTETDITQTQTRVRVIEDRATIG